MKLEVQYREEDLREATLSSIANRTRKTRARNTIIIMALVVIILVLIGFLVFLNRLVSRSPMAYRPPKPEQPTQDVLATLLPSSLVAIGYLLASILLRMGQLQIMRKRTVFSQAAHQRIKVGAVIVGVSVVAVLWLAFHMIDLVPPVEWRASRSLMLLIACIPWIVVLLLMPLVIHWYARATIGAAWEQKTSLHRPRILEITDEHLVGSDENSTSILRWSAFVRYRETDNLFVLVTEDATIIMVPKRYLKDHAMMIEFRALLQSHIADGQFSTVPQGAFPVVNAVTLPPPPLASR